MKISAIKNRLFVSARWTLKSGQKKAVDDTFIDSLPGCVHTRARGDKAERSGHRPRMTWFLRHLSERTSS